MMFRCRDKQQQLPSDPSAPGDDVVVAPNNNNKMMTTGLCGGGVGVSSHCAIVENDQPSSQEQTTTKSTVATTGSSAAAQYISIRLLAMVVLVLWMSSFVFVATTYAAGLMAKYDYHHRQLHNANNSDASSSSLISHWEYKPLADVSNSNTTFNYSTPVRLSALPWSQHIGYITQPGMQVEAYPYNYSIRYLYLMRPMQGFVEKWHFARLSDYNPETGKLIFPHPSPLLYLGYRTADKKSRLGASMYAPTSLVVAQQFWNAVQVVHLFLAMAIYYQYYIYNNNSKLLQSRWQRFGAATAALFVHAVLMQLSHYVSSPGAFIFSIIILTTAMIGLQSDQVLVLDVGAKHQHQQSGKTTALDQAAEDDNTFTTLDIDNDDNDNYDKNDDNDEEQAAFLVSSSSKAHNKNEAPTWFIIQKDLIGLICITCSCLYNYNISANIIPYLVYQYRKIDKFFGWTGGSGSIKKQLYLFHDELYTLGLPGWRVPMYVPRMRGTTFGRHLFVVLWSVIPFFYISYFVALYVMAQYSPWRNIQRALLVFAICHFLFWTDAVNYCYGRGYTTPHAEFFHWTERWSWCIAMLMPLYQSCTNGHWKQGHGQYWPSWSGRAFHFAMAAYGISFFVLDVIFSFAFEFVLFLSGRKVQALYEYFGISRIGWAHFHPFTYLDSLFLFAAVIYPFMIMSGLFTPNFISLQMINMNNKNKNYSNNNNNNKNSTTMTTLTMTEDRILGDDQYEPQEQELQQQQEQEYYDSDNLDDDCG